eukprot:TRINITY_DN2834_c0_g1_i1.p1 TRINITY_DN2834_c0_g1~~TRINITY_DN2834_c0_g1_i1.p1  ORF type:complete len:336 (-),score=44.26 TRINITY_DN2834_c0_g1_i1:229-1236(-)
MSRRQRNLSLASSTTDALLLRMSDTPLEENSNRWSSSKIPIACSYCCTTISKAASSFAAWMVLQSRWVWGATAGASSAVGSRDGDECTRLKSDALCWPSRIRRGLPPSSPHLGTMDTVSMSDVEGGSPLLIRLGQHNASDFNRVHSSPSREPTADDAPAVAPQTQRDCNTIHAANDEAALLIVVQQYEHAIGILLEDHRFEFSSNGVSDILNKSASVVELAKERFRCLRDICGNTSEVFLQLSRFQLAEIFATHSLIFESRLIELQGGDPSHDLTSSFAQKALYRRLRARIGLGDKVSGAEDVGYIRRILEVRASSGENMGCDFEDVARQEKKLQ